MFLRFMSQIGLAMALVFSLSACAENTESNGGSEKELLSASDYFSQYEKDFVVEFFWLGCSHCQDVEPHLSQAKDNNPDVELVRVPATFNERWNLDAAIYFAAVEQMNMDFEPLIGFYKETRLEDEKLPTMNQVATYVAEQGKDSDKFKNLVSSSQVKEQVEQADKLTKDLGVRGTPTFYINGEDEITTQGATSYKDLVDNVYSNVE